MEFANVLMNVLAFLYQLSLSLPKYNNLVYTIEQRQNRAHDVFTQPPNEKENRYEIIIMIIFYNVCYTFIIL